MAIRPISIGDEITFDYTAGGLAVAKIADRFERMDLLQKNLDFQCACDLCKIDDSWIDVD